MNPITNGQILQLHDKVLEILDNLYLFGHELQQKSNNVRSKTKTKSIDLNISKLEKAIQNLIILLKNSKCNIFALIDDLLETIKKCEETSFENLVKKLIKCKTFDIIRCKNDISPVQTFDKETLVHETDFAELSENITYLNNDIEPQSNQESGLNYNYDNEKEISQPGNGDNQSILQNNSVETHDELELISENVIFVASHDTIGIECKNANKLVDASQSPEDETTKEIQEESEKALLDVDMEEILNTSFTDGGVDEVQNQNQLEIKIKKEISEESGDISALKEDLLDLLRDIESPPMEAIKKEHLKDCDLQMTKKEDKDIIGIVKELEEMSDTISDCDSSLSDSDISCSLSLLSDSSNEEKESNEINDTTMMKYLGLTKNKFQQECFVHLERLNENEILTKNYHTPYEREDSIDRLCNLDNVSIKRKSNAPDRVSPNSKRQKKIEGVSSSTESCEDTEVELIDTNNERVELPSELDNRLDEITKLCLEEMETSENNSQDSEHSNEESGTQKKDIKERKKTRNKKKELDDVARKRKSWRNDSLLKGILTSDSESSSDNESTDSLQKENTSKNTSRYEYDTDFNLSSDDNSSVDTVIIENQTAAPSRSPKSSDSDSDSDIEFISEEYLGSQAKSHSPKGRKNIRALVSEDCLSIETQIANKEEKARMERLEERQHLRISYTQSMIDSQSQNSLKDDAGEPLILDLDDENLIPSVQVHPGLTKRLKPHQRDGVQFMWDSCYESIDRLKKYEGSGCILAHCMGLGKTFQVLTLIHTLFTHPITNTRRVLVVCPLSTVKNWLNEFKIAFKNISNNKLSIYTICERKEKSNKFRIVKKWAEKNKSILVIGYECFEHLTNDGKLEKMDVNCKDQILAALINPGPDLIVCDEGHLLRNKKALKTLALHRIRTKRRIVLTGTPLQNNLMEYYHMINFVKPNLLGHFKEFKTNFVNPITNGQYEDSTIEDIKLMQKRTHVLHKLLRKTIQRVEKTELECYIPKMTDYAIFLKLHQVQIELYLKFADLITQQNDSNIAKCFLSDFAMFQYLGTHPYLLKLAEDLRGKSIKETDVIMEEKDHFFSDKIGWWKEMVPIDIAEKIEYGTKLVFLRSILEECNELGEKVIVFSQSIAELNLIEHFLKETSSDTLSWVKMKDYCRMDGTVAAELRNKICEMFNNTSNTRLRLLLMSIKVGGLGMNLTAANRVIIMTVNWNPSYDTQSIFRVYRFGQKKEVYIYRLISLGTMEEKVYQRTITKLAIAHRVVDKHQIARHYKSVDVQELYSCRPQSDIERPTPKVPNDKILAKLMLKYPFIYKYHEHQELLANKPEDDLDEQEKKAAWEEFEREKEAQQSGVPFQQPIAKGTQNDMPGGPTFQQAFNLCRTNVTNLTNRNATRIAVNPIDNISRQYYQSSPLNQNQHNVLYEQLSKLPQNTIVIMGDNNFHTEAGKNFTRNDKRKKDQNEDPHNSSEKIIEDPVLSNKDPGTGILTTQSMIINKNPLSYNSTTKQTHSEVNNFGQPAYNVVDVNKKATNKVKRTAQQANYTQYISPLGSKQVDKTLHEDIPNNIGDIYKQDIQPSISNRAIEFIDVGNLVRKNLQRTSEQSLGSAKAVDNCTDIITLD